MFTSPAPSFSCPIRLAMLSDCVFLHGKLNSHRAICSYNFLFVFRERAHYVRMNGITRNVSQFCGSRAFLYFSFRSLVSRSFRMVGGLDGTAINRNGFRFQELQVFSLHSDAFHGPAAICSVDRHCISITNRSYDFLYTFALARTRGARSVLGRASSDLNVGKCCKIT